MHEVLLILLKTLIGYITLLVLMKFMGKREIGQLSLFDLVILLTIVDIMVVGIENFDDSVLYWISPMVAIAIIQKILALVSLKYVKFRDFIDGKEVVIIYKGIIQIENMKKNRYNMDDLYVQLRGQGYSNPNEVNFAILENNGNLSVFDKTVTDFPLPLITSGRINKDNLKICNIKEADIYSYLKSMNINSLKEVYGLNIINNEFKLLKVKLGKDNN